MSGEVLCGDNLTLLRQVPAGSVDMVYGDPPYNTGKRWSGTAGAFSDVWRWDAETADAYERLRRDDAFPFDVTSVLVGFKSLYGPGDRAAFAVMIAQRMVQIDRVVKRPFGLVWVQCDDTANHLIALVGDALWGRSNRYMVAWKRSAGQGNRKKGFVRVTDTLFCWRTAAWYRPRLLMRAGTVWTDIGIATPKERVGYPTQKPLALLDRIIRISTGGDALVLDPWCGSGTTLVAAARLGRRYLGLDRSPDAVAAAQQRLDQVTIPAPRTEPTVPAQVGLW